MLPGWNQIRQQRMPHLSHSQGGQSQGNEEWMQGNYQQHAGYNMSEMGQQHNMMGAGGSASDYSSICVGQQKHHSRHPAMGGGMMNQQQHMYGQSQQYMPHQQQQAMYKQHMMGAYQQQGMVPPPPDTAPPKQPPPPAPVPPPPPPSDDNPTPPAPPLPEEEKWWVEALSKLNAPDKAKLERLTKEKWFIALKKEQQIECWQHKLQLVSKQHKTETTTTIKSEPQVTIKAEPTVGTVKKEPDFATVSSSAGNTTTSQVTPSVPGMSNPVLNIQEWNPNSHEDPAISLAQNQQQLFKLTQQEKVFEKQYNDWHKQFDDWKRKHQNHPNKSQFSQYEKQWVTWQNQMTSMKTQNRSNVEHLQNNIKKIQQHIANAKVRPPQPQFQGMSGHMQAQMRPNIPGHLFQQQSNLQANMPGGMRMGAPVNQAPHGSGSQDFNNQGNFQSQQTGMSNDFTQENANRNYKGRPRFPHEMLASQQHNVPGQQQHQGQHSQAQHNQQQVQNQQGQRFPGQTNSVQRFPGPNNQGQSFEGQKDLETRFTGQGQNEDGQMFAGQDEQDQRFQSHQNVQGQRFPGQNNQRQRFPGQNDQGQRFPGSNNERQRFPGADGQRQRFPGQNDQEQRTPGSNNQRQRFPGANGQRQRFPGQNDQEPRFPGSNNERQRFPSANGQRQRFPGQNDQEPRFPGSNNERQRFPGANGQRQRFPGQNGQRQRFPGPHQGQRFSGQNEQQFPGQHGTRQRFHGQQEQQSELGAENVNQNESGFAQDKSDQLPGNRVQQETSHRFSNPNQSGPRPRFPRMPGQQRHQGQPFQAQQREPSNTDEELKVKEQEGEEDMDFTKDDENFGEADFGVGSRPRLLAPNVRPRFPGSGMQHRGRMPFRPRVPHPRFRGPRPTNEEHYDEMDQDVEEEYPNAHPGNRPHPRHPGPFGQRFMRGHHSRGAPPRFRGAHPRFRGPAPHRQHGDMPDNLHVYDPEDAPSDYAAEEGLAQDTQPYMDEQSEAQERFQRSRFSPGNRPSLDRNSSVSSSDRERSAGPSVSAGPSLGREQGSGVGKPNLTEMLQNNPLFKGDNLKKLQEHLQAIKQPKVVDSSAKSSVTADKSPASVNTNAVMEKAKSLSSLDLKNILSAVKIVKQTRASGELPANLPTAEGAEPDQQAPVPGGSKEQPPAKDQQTLDKEAIEAALLQRLGLDPALANATKAPGSLDKPKVGTGDPLLDLLGLDTLQDYAGIKDDILLQEYLKHDPQLEKELLLRALHERELLEEAQRLDPLYAQTLEMQKIAEERRALEMSGLGIGPPGGFFGQPPFPPRPMGPHGMMGPRGPFSPPGMPLRGPMGPRGPPMSPMGPRGPMDPMMPHGRMGPLGPMGPPQMWSPHGPRPPFPGPPQGKEIPPEEEKMFDTEGRELGKEDSKPSSVDGSQDDKSERRNSLGDRRSRERSPHPMDEMRRDSIERGQQAVHHDLEKLKYKQEMLGRERFEKEHEERSEQRERSLERLRAIEDDLRKREQLLLQRERELQMARRPYSPDRPRFRERSRDFPPQKREGEYMMERRRSRSPDPRDFHRGGPPPPDMRRHPDFDYHERRSPGRGHDFPAERMRRYSDERPHDNRPPGYHPDMRRPDGGGYDVREREHDHERPPSHHDERYQPRPFDEHERGRDRDFMRVRRSESPPMEKMRPYDHRRPPEPDRREMRPRGDGGNPRERFSPPRGGSMSPPRRIDRPMSPPRRNERRSPPRKLRRSRSRSPQRGNKDRFGRDMQYTKGGRDQFGRDVRHQVEGGGPTRSPRLESGPPMSRGKEGLGPPPVKRSPTHSSSGSGRGTPTQMENILTRVSSKTLAASMRKALLAPAFVNVADLIDMPGRMRRPAKIAVVLRGLPGSGKTHIAKLIRDKEASFGVKPRVLSMDNYFMAEVEKIEKDPDTGKKVSKKVLEYEYEPEMEESYLSNLLRSFRKTCEDGYFSFVIVDAVNQKVAHFAEFYDSAKSFGFEVYVAEIRCDPHTCARRNVHNRALGEIQRLAADWEDTAMHMNKLDLRLMVQDSEIQEVEMDDAMDDESAEKADGGEDDGEDGAGNKEQSSSKEAEKGKTDLQKSKWESESAAARLDKLDGITKKSVKRSMEDFLSLPDDYDSRKSAPGKKRVRWADIHERKTQQRMRDVGFVVGQTDWSRMMDDTHATRALNRTKFI